MRLQNYYAVIGFDCGNKNRFVKINRNYVLLRTVENTLVILLRI